MPSRVIRGELNSSDSLSRVSLEADLTFRALLLVVDDFGRFDGRLGVLKAALFPLRQEMTHERIDACLVELVTAGCLQRFENGGRPYLALPNWEKHRAKGRRGDSSKYPDPADASSEILGTTSKSEEQHDDPRSERLVLSEGRGAAPRDDAGESEEPDLGGEFFSELAAPLGNPWGVPLDPTRVERWFRWKWHTAMRARGFKPRGLKRAIRSWWMKERLFARGKTIDQVLGEAELWCRNVEWSKRPREESAPKQGDLVPLVSDAIADDDGLVFDTLEVAS